LLHGLASNAHIWDLVAPSLAAVGLDSFAPDARGHGLSDKPEDYRFEAMIADLAAFLDVCEIERPALIGHSWGGMVALEYAARFPAGLRSPRSLVLVDGGFSQLDDQPGATWEAVSDRLAPPHLAGMPLETFMEKIQEWTAAWRPDEAVFPIILANFQIDENELIAPHLTYARHMRILREIWEFQTYQRFDRIRCPVLMIPAVSPAPLTSQDELSLAAKKHGITLAKQSIRQLKVNWMDETIHDIPLQRPNELAVLIRDFLEEII
jgi:pimeloyl-ACP methyl ester carboxylesterase